MVYDILNKHYSNYNEDARLRSRHGMVEFLTTVKYIEKYLRPDSRIIEIGAGTGRYSHYFAQNGYRVDAVELLEHNIEIFKQNTKPNENITVTQGNALDLSEFEDAVYDIVLLLGPMYHLYTDDDRRKAISEAMRIAKNDGVIFVAYCGNEATMMQECFKYKLVTDPHFSKLMDETFKCSSNPEDLFVLFRKSEIDKMMESFDVHRLHFVGTDMYTHYVKDQIYEMDDEIYEIYLKYHFAICEREDLVGISNHFLDIFRKKERT
ncbi:MAG: class I SAM-dependent methyltransferase [Clostridia bacterium]|nr:class I SAM-dependent methyltransferase [Clostridia bacterium]